MIHSNYKNVLRAFHFPLLMHLAGLQLADPQARERGPEMGGETKVWYLFFGLPP